MDRREKEGLHETRRTEQNLEAEYRPEERREFRLKGNEEQGLPWI